MNRLGTKLIEGAERVLDRRVECRNRGPGLCRVRGLLDPACGVADPVAPNNGDGRFRLMSTVPPRDKPRGRYHRCERGPTRGSPISVQFPSVTVRSAAGGSGAAGAIERA